MTDTFPGLLKQAAGGNWPPHTSTFLRWEHPDVVYGATLVDGIEVEVKLGIETVGLWQNLEKGPILHAEHLEAHIEAYKVRPQEAYAALLVSDKAPQVRRYFGENYQKLVELAHVWWQHVS